MELVWTPMAIGMGHMESCYFPFLLSKNHYITIKNSKLQKILLTDQLNVSHSSKLRPEDTNKLTILGLIYYLLQMGILIALYILSFYICFIDVIGDNIVNRQFFLHIWFGLEIVSALVVGGFSFLYWIDYGLGKLINGTGL